MELELADLEKENPKYLRKDIDGGILNEKYEIDRYKLEQYNDVIENLMLGNYNEFGEYFIQDEIKEELIKCRKVIEDNYENILFVKSENSVNAFSFLNFAVKVIDSDKAGYKMAVLELLEPIYKAKGYIENTQATILKKIVLPNNDVFKSSVYEAFNIIVDNNGGKKYLNDDEEFKNTLDRKIRLLYVKKQIKVNDDYMICYKKNVEELEKTEKGKKVLKDYEKEETIAKKYLNLEENDYKTKNELLTESIEKVFEVLPKPISNNLIVLQKCKSNYINKMIDKLQNKIKKEEQKPKVVVLEQPKLKIQPTKRIKSQQKSIKNIMDDVLVK